MDMELIHQVVKKLRKRKFGFMEEADIAQEAYILCLDIVKKWDGVRSLENFLMLSVSNRLISLARTYYRNPDYRKSIDFAELTDRPIEEYEFPDLDLKDQLEKTLAELPVAMRADFQRMAQGVPIPPTRRDALFEKVREINEEG